MDNTALPGFSSLGVRAHDIFDDFLWDDAVATYGPTSLAPVISASAIAVAELTAPTDNTYSGLLSVSTGTNSNNNSKGGWQSSGGINKIKVGGAALTIEWRVRVPILSDTTGVLQYRSRIGLQDGAAIGNPVNGIYFYYTGAENSGKWIGVCRNASTESVVVSAITVAANIWYKLRMEINSAGTNVNFFIDNAYIGNLTINIPTTNGTRLLASIERWGTGSNTSVARVMHLDYLYFRTER